MTPIPHGGRLLAARARHPSAPAPFIDLSTGINPDAYRFDPPGADAWRRLPEPESLAALEHAAARAYGLRDPACIVAAPGTQALIQLLPRVAPQPQITIVSPTYAEHAAAWAAAGTAVRHAGRVDGAACVVCNPNNPDGARHAPVDLLNQAAAMDLLVVDEAFADFEPGLSLGPSLPRPNIVVLRSFGKAYGLAGLRLGFAILNPDAAAQLRTAMGPWPISGPAIAIGTQALMDTAWQAKAAATAHAAAARLDALLLQSGMRPAGGTALFRTAETPNAAASADRLAQAGILVRQFGYAPTWLRFGLPPNEDAWSRLTAALQP